MDDIQLHISSTVYIVDFKFICVTFFFLFTEFCDFKAVRLQIMFFHQFSFSVILFGFLYSKLCILMQSSLSRKTAYVHEANGIWKYISSEIILNYLVLFQHISPSYFSICSDLRLPNSISHSPLCHCEHCDRKQLEYCRNLSQHS